MRRDSPTKFANRGVRKRTTYNPQAPTEAPAIDREFEKYQRSLRRFHK